MTTKHKGGRGEGRGYGDDIVGGGGVGAIGDKFGDRLEDRSAASQHVEEVARVLGGMAAVLESGDRSNVGTMVSEPAKYARRAREVYEACVEEAWTIAPVRAEARLAEVRQAILEDGAEEELKP